MAMSVGKEDGDDVPMSDINTTPLVDVMLVLLIIFLIAVPVVVESVPIALPKTAYEVRETKPENVELTVRGGPGDSCEVYLGMRPIDSQALLDTAVKKLEDAVKKAGGAENLTEDTMPEVHIRGDVNTPYKCIGGTIFQMQRAGFARVGFVSEPPPGAAVTRL
ncbi:ExbD/TolR family protein [Sphingomonas astaxanthinifaciens]|uniref:Biopolymer transporter ExbD n=1 Tax=Sphingomonas astaxanthinifaciens DSM 22298 TaxID=1123267 RepID=A0ABQ5Z6D6_9SPHN|nr:biopolymer transporter ExbD [Sphingomonas astaxanthinifaciens]GLR46458.1 biopolymer transporter ExbD [Sphingomonas astaxanthinifaciens DSM 22298]